MYVFFGQYVHSFSTWLQTDNLISGARSTVPFSKAECEDLSRVVAELSRQWFNAVDSATRILSPC